MANTFPETLDKDELANALYEILEEGDAVLFKASRGVRLERLIEYVKEHY